VRSGDYWPSRWRSERAKNEGRAVYFFRLIALTELAMAIDDRPWLRRHIWWRLLSYQLRNELPTAPLDG